MHGEGAVPDKGSVLHVAPNPAAVHVFSPESGKKKVGTA